MDAAAVFSASQTQSAARWGVPLLYVIFTAGAMAYTLAFAHPLPVEDEFALTRFVVEGAPDLLQLWGQHNEHRIPLPRLLYHAVSVLSGADSRAVLLVSVALLAAGALFFLLAARELRGRFVWGDALIPLLLLHPGHQTTLLNAFQLCFTLYAFCMGVLFYSALRWPRHAQASLLGCALALGGMILTSSAGVILALAFMPWLVWKIWDVSGVAPTNVKRLAALIVIAIMVLLFLYLFGLKTQKYARSPALADTLLAAGKFLGNAYGPGLSGFAGGCGAMLAALFLYCAWRWVRDWRSGRVDNAASASLLLAAGVLGLALVFGHTRASFGTAMAQLPRYIVLSAPLVCILWIVIERQRDWFGRGGRLALMLFLSLSALAALPGNVVEGMRQGRERQALFERVMRDYRDGESFAEIAVDYDPQHTTDAATIARLLSELEKQRLSAFKQGR